MNVLITSVGTSTAINLIKEFKLKTNYRLIGVDINKYGYTAGSMMVDEYFQVPYARTAEYVSTIKTLVDNFLIDLVIPINDAEITAIAESEDKPLLGKCMIPRKDVLEVLTDKYRCNEFVRSLDIPVPKYVSTDTPIKKIRRDKVGVGSKGISFFSENEIIKEYYSDQQIIQEFVEGEEYTVDVLTDRDGNILYCIPRKRIEIKNGVATKVKVEHDDQIIECVRRIATELKIAGFSNYQFIKDKNDKIWFVEINGRFSGCGAATLKAAPEMFKTYISIIENDQIVESFNKDIFWNAVITRYYEEMLYIEKEGDN